MAHFDEMNCLLYLDGQLDSLRKSELELHMRSCTPCRALLAALENESNFLRASVTEEYEAIPAHLLTPPQPDRVPWGWISALGMACAGLSYLANAVSGYAGQFSEAGFSSIYLVGQAISNAAFWKGWSDVMNALIILSAALVALPLAWFGWRGLRRIRPVAVVLAGLGLFLMLPATAGATRIEKGQSAFTLRADETEKQDLIVLAGTVRIEGTVDGDLIVFSEGVTITGHVTGDVLGFTRRLRITGVVDGNVRVAANQVDIDGQIGHSVTSFSEGFQISEKGSVGGSLIHFADGSDIDGKVQRDVMTYAARSRVSGTVGGDMRIHARSCRFSSSANVGGKIEVRGRKEPEIMNEALRSKAHFIPDEREGPDYSQPAFYWRQMLRFGAAFFFGLTMMLLMPGFYDSVLRNGRRYGPALGVGLLTLVATPILVLLACITLVGIALGVGGLMLWITLLYSAQVAVGGWIGTRILGDSAEIPARVGRLALGLLVIRIAGNLPQVSFVVWLVILMWGVGAIMLALFRSIRAGLDASIPVAAATASAAPPAVPA